MTSFEPTSRPLVGLALVTLAVLFFACSDVLVKYLTQIYPVPVVVSARYLSALALLFVLVWPRIGHRLWRAERLWLVLIRGATLTAGSLSVGIAFKLMPVGETVSIMYLAPFAVMLIAVPLLGEKVTPLGVFLAVFGFVGVLLILRPGGGLDPVGVVFALLNAVCATAFHLLTRALTHTETGIAMLFHVSLVGAVVSTITAVPYVATSLPTWQHLALMVLMGSFATFGHFLFVAAYREAPASLIAPMNYIHLVWAALLGWVIFGHVPALLTILGMAMIIAAGVAIATHGHMYERRGTRPQPEMEAP